jgi:hypothetical protein
MSLLEKFDGMIGTTFIETGTCEGNSLNNARHYFERCLSVEQNAALRARAIKRFELALNVEIHEGDSPLFLRNVITDVPTTFWLDAHYFENGDTLGPSGQCPLLAELRAITSFPWTQPHMVLIDDAFMFDDKINHPGSQYPFWISNESNHSNYNRVHWPKIDEIDGIMEKYEKSMHGEFILQYVWSATK